MWRSAPGEECFTPRPGTTPAVGTADEITCRHSTQVIFSISRNQACLNTALNAIFAVHPWEEPVFFVDETKAMDSRG